MWTYGDSFIVELDSNWFFPINWLLSFPFILRGSTVGIPFAIFVSKTFVQYLDKNFQRKMALRPN
jgi:hypothetical protein